MPADALALALAAAVVHAAWNILLSGAEDVHSATAVAAFVGVVVFAPVAAATWRLQAGALPYIAASGALETLYILLLATAYSRAAMSFVYPIARGSAPVYVLAVGALVLGAAVSVAAAIGVALVASGIVLVRGMRAAGRASDLGFALVIGASIAGYTLVDKHGITHGAPIAYLELVFGLMSGSYLLGVWRVRGGAALLRALGARTAFAGVGFFGSYALVLAALRLAPAASVAAVRESSVVLAAGALALSGRERVTAGRLAGAAAVAAGIALISLG